MFIRIVLIILSYLTRHDSFLTAFILEFVAGCCVAQPLWLASGCVSAGAGRGG